MALLPLDEMCTAPLIVHVRKNDILWPINRFFRLIDSPPCIIWHLQFVQLRYMVELCLPAPESNQSWPGEAA